MKIDIDEPSPVQRKIRVELPPEAVTHQFSRAYQDLGRRVRIKGFRAGKAPRSVLQGIYGDEIKGQVRSQLVEDSLSEVIKERGLQIVSRPEIEANDLEEGHGFSFSAVFEIKPEIEVKDYVNVEVEKVKLAVTDAQVESALERLRESYARLEPETDREVVQEGDFVSLDFEGSIAGKPFADGKGENYLLEIGGGRALPQFESAVVGLRVGQHQTVQVTYPDNYSNRELAGKAVDFSVVVHEIKRKILPVLDDDFAKDHGQCASLEELKVTIRTRLEDELKQIQNEELKEQIINQLIARHSFTPPPAMVERQTRYLMERNQNRGTTGETSPSLEETRKALEGRALRQVQATLLVEKVAALENIEVSEKEVQERVDNLARGAGEKGKTVREFYSRPEARDDLRSQMIFDRTLAFLLERAKIKEVDSEPAKVDDQAKKS
jgi:trigger factor